MIRLLISSLLFTLSLPVTAQTQPQYGIAMHGQPAQAKDFTHYPYVNPDAPKGGQIIIAKLGQFDTLNPFSIRGSTAHDIRHLVFESLMSRAQDEPFTLYGLIAKSVIVPDNRRSITFILREDAKFSDGVPLTSADVYFSWQKLRKQGRPNHRHYYNKVARAKIISSHKIRFDFKPDEMDRELPLILGLMPVLPKHIYKNKDLQNISDSKPLIGSGPYLVEVPKWGAQVKFMKNPDYWGSALPVNQGRYNFDTIRHDYYRDETAAFEAFKAGHADIWLENDILKWQQTYDFPSIKNKSIRKKSIQLGTPSGLYAIIMNSRNLPLSDKKIRQAMALLFDFEWINKTFYGGAYTRTHSYFGNSPLTSNSYMPPRSDGSGRDRKNIRKALALLEEASMSLPFDLEILVHKNRDKRIALSYATMLKPVGINLNVRFVDSSQYQRRLQNFDFDMIFYDYYASLSPGNEQSHYWSSKAANTVGSRNYAGIQSAKIDAAIADLIAARGREDFTAAAQRLDAGLMEGDYMIPLFHSTKQNWAHYKYIKAPATPPLYGLQIDSLWRKK